MSSILLSPLSESLDQMRFLKSARSYPVLLWWDKLPHHVHVPNQSGHYHNDNIHIEDAYLALIGDSTLEHLEEESNHVDQTEAKK